MVLFIILGAVVLITFAVIGVLFFMLNKEGQKEEKAVPLADLDDLKKEFSAALRQAPKPKDPKDPQIIPPLEPKVSLPVQTVQAPVEDNVYKKRAQELEDELKIISQKAEGQSNEAKQLIEVLTKENETLKSQKANLVEAEQKLNDLQGEASSLKVDNLGLQSQLETTNAKVRLLEEQMTSVKLQMGEEISRANATVAELSREKEALLSAPKPVLESDQNLRQELDALRDEQVQLKQKYEDLEKERQKLEYELVKARAQSSGLERVSFNYKNQLEDSLKKVNAAEQTNGHLSEAKNRLEGEVTQVRSANEELVQKDQLAQFELEKNHARLVSLERECEELKARVQQQGQQ